MCSEMLKIIYFGINITFELTSIPPVRVVDTFKVNRIVAIQLQIKICAFIFTSDVWFLGIKNIRSTNLGKLRYKNNRFYFSFGKTRWQLHLPSLTRNRWIEWVLQYISENYIKITKFTFISLSPGWFTVFNQTSRTFLKTTS